MQPPWMTTPDALSLPDADDPAYRDCYLTRESIHALTMVGSHPAMMRHPVPYDWFDEVAAAGAAIVHWMPPPAGPPPGWVPPPPPGDPPPPQAFPMAEPPPFPSSIQTHQGSIMPPPLQLPPLALTDGPPSPPHDDYELPLSSSGFSADFLVSSDDMAFPEPPPLPPAGMSALDFYASEGVSGHAASSSGSFY